MKLHSLYHEIATACFFQNKLAKCREYIDKTLEIADRLDNKILRADAMQMIAMIETCHGDLQRLWIFELLKVELDFDGRWRSTQHQHCSLSYGQICRRLGSWRKDR